MKQRLTGLLRGAAGRVTTPLLPDDYLRLLNPLWTTRELRGRVVEVRRETADSATLVIKPGWGFNFDYRPGQYIGIGVRVAGRWHWRSYSLTSPPRSGDRTVSIAVKAMPEGFLSTHLVAGIPPGTIVRLASPAGDFRLPDPPPPRILFLTAGSGITPVMGMLRTMDRRGQLGDVAHVHSAPDAPEVMFAAELAELAAGHSGYRCHIRLTRSSGKLTLPELDGLVADWNERHTWACGPVAMLNEIEAHWRAGSCSERLHTERFDPGFGRNADRTIGAGGTVTFARAGRSVVADGATTLLQAGESVGVTVPFGCRMGICRTCVVALTDGVAVDLRSGDRHFTGEKVQACVCAAAGDCVVDC